MVKFFKSAMIFASMLAVTSSFVACDDDEEKEEPSNGLFSSTIEGLFVYDWGKEEVGIESENGTIALDFKADGTFSFYDANCKYDGFAHKPGIAMGGGTYVCDGKKVTLEYTNGTTILGTEFKTDGIPEKRLLRAGDKTLAEELGMTAYEFGLVFRKFHSLNYTEEK